MPLLNIKLGVDTDYEGRCVLRALFLGVALVLLPPSVSPATETAAPASLSHAERLYRVLVAEFAARRGQLASALDYYREVAGASDDPRLAERAANLALYANDDDALLELARRWQELRPEHLPAQQVLALALLRNGRIADAVEPLDQVRAALAERDGQDGFAGVANLLRRLDDKIVVLEAMRALSQRHPESPYGHYHRALTALAVDRPEAALQNLDRALGLEPDWREALLLQAQLRIQQGQTERGLDQVLVAVEARPEDTELRLGYARLLISASRLDEAREQFTRLAEQNPDDAEALFALGVLATEAEQYTEAESYFEQVLALGQREADSLFELGRISELRGDFATARDWYEQVQEGERTFNARIRAATMSARLGEFDDLHMRFERLRSAHPDEAISLYITEAEILRSEQREQQSFELLNDALASHSGNHDLLYSRALAAERIDRLDVVEEDLRRILAEDPDNGHALNALGYTLADRTERYQEALDLIERALELLPEDPAVLDSMGWVQYKLGNLEPALEYLRRAHEQTEEPEIVMHLSEVLWAAGQREEAREIWQQAYDQAPENPFLLRLKDRFMP